MHTHALVCFVGFAQDHLSRDEAKRIMEKWRGVDLSIVDALMEAKDNFRFLSNLKEVIKPLKEHREVKKAFVVLSVVV